MFRKSAWGMLGCNSVFIVGTMAEFCVNSGEDLLGGGWTFRKGKTVCVVILILVKDGVLGVGGDRGRKRKSRG